MQLFQLSADTGHRTRTLALGLSALLLSGCGGGGGDSDTPTPSPADYLATGFVSSNSGSGKTLLVIDPARPDQVRLAVGLSATENYQKSLAVAVSPNGQTATLLGESMVYYVKNRQVFQVDLLKSTPSMSQRISSLDTACTIGFPIPLRLGGVEAWLPVTDAGPDGDCASAGDNGKAYVRTGTPEGTAATRLPPGVSLLDEGLPLLDETFKVQYLMAKDTRDTIPKYTLYGPELTPAGKVEGAAGLTRLWPQYPLSWSDQSTYASADGSLRRFSWSANGATLSPAIHVFKSTDAYWVSDGDAFFFQDGPEIYRMAGNASPVLLATLDSTQGRVTLSPAQTPTTLIVMQRDNEGSGYLDRMFSLPKAGGPLFPLVQRRNMSALGVIGEDVIYEYINSALMDGVESVGTSIRRIGVDGQRDRLISSSRKNSLQHVFPGTFMFAAPDVAGLVWCEPAADEADCRNGPLIQYDAGSEVTTQLGRFTHTADYLVWNPVRNLQPTTSFAANAPFVFVGSGMLPNSQDFEHEVYVAKPGVAGSLVRVTAP